MTPRSWDDLLADPAFHWEEPDPGIVRVAGRWQRLACETVWDLGCGAGRHLIYLEALGFAVCGSDVSDNGLRVSRERLQAAGMPARLVQADMTVAPFLDASLDAVVSINVLNHNPRARLQQAVDEVYRVLRPGGEFYLTVLTTWDWRYGLGEETEPDSFILSEGPETGILHHFFDEADLRAWLGAFDLLELRRERGELKLSTRPGGEPVMRDGWAVLVRKR